ncbi:hypothetical protein AMJ80_07380 [bacterium SM23_31]|nr:MAG: hypothetical protein AMJ80_07380 [bacterium SM23_31]
MNSLSVGIVGVGHLGEAHLRKYLDIPEAELAGFWDIDDRVRNAIRKKYSVRAFDSLESLLENVQAVSIVVPTSSHASAATAAAEKGVHIFIEKPIAPNLADADRIIDAARKNNIKLQVGHIERFNAAFRSLFAGAPPLSGTGYPNKEINPKFIESHRLASFDPRGLDVSVIHDLMIHDIDLILQLIGSPIMHIDASGVGVISDMPDIVNARLSFANGAVANITASRISQKKMRKMRLFQKDSYISMDFVTGETEIYSISDSGSSESVSLLDGIIPVMNLNYGDITKSVGYKKIPNDGKDALELELRSFLHSITTDTDPPVTGEEARKALEVALEVVEKTMKN